MPENYQDWLNLISGMDINGYKEFYYGPRYSNFVGAARKYSSANQIKKLTGIPGLSQLNVPGQTKLAPITFSKTGPDFLQKLKLAGSKINMDQVGGIASGVSGLAGIVGDSANISRGQFTNDDLTNLNNDQQEDLFAFNQAAGNANTTSDLIHLTGLRPDFGEAVGNIETSKYNAGKTLGAMGKGALAGASIGSVIPGIGTAIGAIAGGIFGGISNAIGQGIGISGDNRRKSQAELEAERLGNMAYNSMLHAGTKVSTNTYRQGMANYLNNAAMGGPLSTHGSDFTDDLIRIDVGGSHERNPLGGVPAGVDPNGIPNLVEEGETIWDNGNEEYVFSKRLKAPKALVKKFALGGGKKGLTYSEAARKASEKSGAELRPNDPISKRTKDAILAELEASQEEKRIAKEQRDAIKAMSEMSPEEFQATMMNSPMTQQEIEQPQMPPQGVNEEPVMQEAAGYEPQGLGIPGGFAYGGFLSDANVFKGGGNKREERETERLKNAIESGSLRWDNKLNKWVGTTGIKGEGLKQYSNDYITRTLGYNPRGNEPSKTPFIDNTGVPKYEDPWFNNRIEPNLRGLIGRSVVDLKNPWYSYLIPEGTPENPERLSEAQIIADRTVKPAVNNTRTTKLGAGITQLAKNVPQETQEWTPNKIFSVSSINPVDTWRKGSLMYNVPKQRTPVQAAMEGPTESEVAVSVGGQQNGPFRTWMRYAPIVGGGLSVLSDMFNRPDYSGYERLMAEADRTASPINIPVVTIGDRIRRNPFDERLAVNQANQNLVAGLRSTTNNAGGNRAYRQFANNLMAYNNQAQLSDVYRNSYLANRQDALQAADFNRGTGIQNMNAINQRNLTQAQLNANRGYQGYYARANALNALENARRYDDQMASADFTAFMQSLGNLGKEREQRNWLTSLANEGVLDWAMGRNGEISFVPRVAKNGGKVKTKKRRF